MRLESTPDCSADLMPKVTQDLFVQQGVQVDDREEEQPCLPILVDPCGKYSHWQVNRLCINDKMYQG